VAVWLAEGDRRRECAWAAGLARMDGASLPVPGFGASDCRCPAHLIHFPDLPDREPFERIVGEAVQAGVIGQPQRTQRRAA
jgi:Uri superfamily endonuclease